MKLAEALLLRADLDRSIDDIRNRIVNNCVVQEGTTPAEDPAELLEELNVKLSEHEKLVVNINSTNLKVKTERGLTLTEAIARRDKLSRLHGILTSVNSNASSRTDRYSKTEILNITTIDVQSVQKKLDNLAKQRREIEVEIQSANWTNDLIIDEAKQA